MWLGLWFCHYSSFSYFYPLSGGKVIWEEGNRGIEVQLIHLLDFTNSSEESRHYNTTTINNFLHLICCMSIHECIHLSKNYLNPKVGKAKGMLLCYYLIMVFSMGIINLNAVYLYDCKNHLCSSFDESFMQNN